MPRHHKDWETPGSLSPMEAPIDSVGNPVPEPLRDALGLTPGSTVEFSRYGAGLQLVPTERTARRSMSPGCSWQPGTARLTTRWSSGLLTPAGVDRAGARYKRRHPAAGTDTPRPRRCRSLVEWPRRGTGRACAGGDVLGTHSTARRLTAGASRRRPTDHRALWHALCTWARHVRAAPVLGRLGIAGCGVYDALVAMAAVEHGATIPASPTTSAAPSPR